MVAPPAGGTRAATAFIVLVGVVSLFADMTYEGARSITGPFLAVLGASGAVVGVVAGFGELAGYALRLASGWWADRSGRYWAITIFGYAVNLGAVPLLALADAWPLAAALMVTERIGKAIRTPARDAMLSHATHRTGHGWGFGLHEALDQTGATIGPLAVAVVLGLKWGYAGAFALLAIPALLSIGVLLAAWRLYPRPEALEIDAPALRPAGFAGAYWWYVGAACCVALGYADYPLLAYHFEKAGSVPAQGIAVLYAVAMAVDGAAALVFGRWFDRRGLRVLAAATVFSALFAPLAFFGGFAGAIAGAVLWGIGMGAQESIMRAAVAALTPAERRGTAYGLFNTCFGVSWFAGSALMGALYDLSIPALVAFSVAAQLAALPLFFASRRRAARVAPA